MRCGGVLFNVVVLQENGSWVAQCLDFDVAAQGATIPEAKKALGEILGEHIVMAVHQQREPFAGIPPAPQAYWQPGGVIDGIDWVGYDRG